MPSLFPDLEPESNILHCDRVIDHALGDTSALCERLKASKVINGYRFYFLGSAGYKHTVRLADRECSLPVFSWAVSDGVNWILFNSFIGGLKL